MPERLTYNGHLVEFEDPEDPRIAALLAGEDIGVDPDAAPAPADEPEPEPKAKPAPARARK